MTIVLEILDRSLFLLSQTLKAAIFSLIAPGVILASFTPDSIDNHRVVYDGRLEAKLDLSDEEYIKSRNRGREDDGLSRFNFR